MSKEQNKEMGADISKKEITADYIKKEFPDVASAIIEEVSATIKNEAFASGTKHERDRILAIESASLPGHEDLIAEAKKDSSITAEKLALKIISAEKKKASDYLANSKTSESEMPKIDPNIEPESKKKEEIDANLPIEQRAKNLWDKDSKLRSEFGDDFESYHAFAKAEEGNQVRILSK